MSLHELDWLTLDYLTAEGLHPAVARDYLHRYGETGRGAEPCLHRDYFADAFEAQRRLAELGELADEEGALE